MGCPLSSVISPSSGTSSGPAHPAHPREAPEHLGAAPILRRRHERSVPGKPSRNHLAFPAFPMSGRFGRVARHRAGVARKASEMTSASCDCSSVIARRGRRAGGALEHVTQPPELQESPAKVSPAPLRKARARAPRDPSARRARAARARPAGRAADGAVGRHRRASRACDRRAGCPVHRRSRRASRR